MNWNEPRDLMPGLRTTQVAFVFFGTVAPVLIIFIAWNFLAAAWHTPTAALAYEYLVIAIVMTGVGVLGVSLGHIDWTVIGFRRCSSDWIVRALLLVPVLYGFATFWRGLLLSFNVPRQQFPSIAEDQLILASGAPLLIAGQALAIGLFTPIVQEALLRGVLYAWLRRYMSFAIAAVASSPIFGLFHINVERFGSAMIVGIICAALYESSKSLWPSIALHMGANLVYVVYVFT